MPPGGGIDVGKVPLGLFTRHQIPTQFVAYHSFPAIDWICVWFLHPSQPRWNSTLWPKSAVPKSFSGPIWFDETPRFCHSKTDHKCDAIFERYT